MNTTAEMLECARKARRELEAETSRTLVGIRTHLDDNGKALLVASQRAWLDYREADCKVESDLYRGGSLQPVVLTLCQAERTESRVMGLRNLLGPSRTADPWPVLEHKHVLGPADAKGAPAVGAPFTSSGVAVNSINTAN